MLLQLGGGVARGDAVRGRALGPWPADLDVCPGFGDLVVVAVAAPECPAHVVQRPGHVPAASSWGCRMWSLSRLCRVSSMVTESTRNGMSSVMMSTTRRDGSNAPGEPAGRTRTRARPCGRRAASRACSSAAAATVAWPGRRQVLDRDVL